MCLFPAVRIWSLKLSLSTKSIISFKSAKPELSLPLYIGVYSLIPSWYWAGVIEIGKGADLYCCLFIWSIYQGEASRLRLHTRTSVRIPSTSCAYHKGNVSLSPLVKSMALGAHDSR